MSSGALTFLALAVAAVVAGVPAIRTPAARLLDHVRNPSPRRRAATALLVAVIAIAYLLLTAWQQGRDLIPKFHDEHMHLLQMRHLAHGKLWTSPHALRDFFETFHVIHDERVYASVYFPGTALMYLPTIWLGLPFWLLPVIVAGAAAGMLYRVTAELIDGVAGLLAAGMLVSLQWFRYLSLMVMSHGVMLLLGLLIVWAWLRWRRERSLKWAAGMGALIGWAAITRPVDAICYTAPVALAMVFDLRGAPLKRWVATFALACVAAAPFLALQVIENVGVTGKPLYTPYRMYADLDTPQMSFGFHDFDPAIRPRTTLRQRQDYYDQFTAPAAKAHRPERVAATWLNERFPLLAQVTLPTRLLVVLLPLSVFALRPAIRMVLWGVLPLWVALYALFAYVLPVYCVVISPAMLLGVLLGKDAVERWSGRWRRGAAVFLTSAIALLSLAGLPGIDREVIDDGFLTPTMWFSYVEAPKTVQTPAIILFRYTPPGDGPGGGGYGGDDVDEEPVYNVDVVNPDDAPIIRAHDLGVEPDRVLFDYYAKRQPDRTVYLFDRKSRQFVRLGNVAELARRLGEAVTSQPSPSQ
ncbi:MAG: hypothetical protein ABIP55_11330 [Tepidisphaeraceae bacterium]